ncbi:hypothetical protein K370107A2_10680 [Merdimmobilis hominis]|jgi:hypothetical protein
MESGLPVFCGGEDRAGGFQQEEQEIIWWPANYGLPKEDVFGIMTPFGPTLGNP